jgi:hypothetical protein
VARLPAEATFNLDTDAWLVASYEAASRSHDQLMPQLFAGLDRILERAGRMSSKHGRRFSWDDMIDDLETMELNFDANGKPSELTIVAGPELAETMRVTQMTPEQQRRWDEVIEQKREEFNARRRRRILD